jgi:hypothetical protein
MVAIKPWKDAEDMEKCSRNVEMSDAALAADLIRDVAGERGHDEPIKTLWEKAYQRLAKRSTQWTRRRVRALWEREAARIEYREIKEMTAAIREQETLRHARQEHREYLDRLARLEALLVARDADFHSPEIGAVRGNTGRVDRAGD